MITHYAELMANSSQARFDLKIRWDKATRDSARAAAEACRTDPNWDNHSMMAGFIFGDDYKQADYMNPDSAGHKTAKHLRGNAKTTFLGKCYGMGGGKLCYQEFLASGTLSVFHSSCFVLRGSRSVIHGRVGLGIG